MLLIAQQSLSLGECSLLFVELLLCVVEILPVAFPTTWLLTTGWKRHRKVSPWERPGTG